MKYTPLTPNEIEEEREIANRRVAFLDAKFAALSPQRKQQLTNELTKTAAQAVKMLCEKLVQWKIQSSSDKPIRANLCILSSSEMPILNGRIASGAAWPGEGIVGVLNHLVFAPKEVLRSVVIHECLHLMYPHMKQVRSKQLACRMAILVDYREDRHVEEEWVRTFEARICGSNHNLEYWELAVEEFGDNWKPAYEKLKQQKSTRN
jgi:hypothetical protein